MRRRSVNATVSILLAVLALGAASCAGSYAANKPPAPPEAKAALAVPADTMLGVAGAATFTTGRLGDRLYHIRGTAAGGVLVLVGKEGLLLVDSGDAAEGAELDAAIAEVSTLPVKWVINTHAHFDHIGGNPRFRKRGARIVAHANVPVQAKKDTVIADWNNWHRRPAPDDAMPTVTITDTMTIDFEGTPVQLIHTPAAHTDGDLLVWFPSLNVLHAGDIIEIGGPLFIDFWSGGTIGGIFRGIDRMISMTNDSTAIVPGHGDAIDRPALRNYRRTLAHFSTLAQESIDAGRTLERFLAMEPGKEHGAPFGGPDGARQVAIIMYYGLNGMKK